MSNLSRRDFLKLSSLSLLSTAFLRFEPNSKPYQAQSVLYKGSAHFSRVALTYDDCYLITMLRRLETILGDNPDAHVTFFPVGEALLSTNQKEEGIWKRFRELGHEIGYHSFDHTDPEVMSSQHVLEDYDRWYDALCQVLEDQAPVVRFARPPYGNTSSSFLNMCTQRGLVPTMWSTGWGGPTESVVNYTVPKIQPGDIVLLHTRIEDMNTSEEAIPELADRGIQAVTLSRLYFDLLKVENESSGCYADPYSLSRTCIE